jgi:hypothetical protein
MGPGALALLWLIRAFHRLIPRAIPAQPDQYTQGYCPTRQGAVARPVMAARGRAKCDRGFFPRFAPTPTFSPTTAGIFAAPQQPCGGFFLIVVYGLRGWSRLSCPSTVS